ncbi:hypothetical protein [Amycolatopsis keratiniphila]|uniref:Uncharacterized protein n=1 Tax=Amycolatopsis keratiniphila TaxID=129921 RepID=R4T5J9_9PSEU|nr:hypothetical protein [Amycolatopsis keratiniphila]AGM10125.1 hypothetical protein AORI_7543 [Amycolatopsis keratiniphila]
MAKTSIPGLKLGGGKTKWLVGVLLVLVLVLIVKSPIEAAGFGKSVFGAIDTATTSVVTFFNSF